MTGNTLTIINMLREKGIATSCIRFMGAARASQSDRQIMSRLTQTELDAALRWQK